MVWTFIPVAGREPASTRADSSPASFPVISNYPYQPLNPATHTRLLSISPGDPDSSSITCSLSHASHIDNHEYEALSYVWGNAVSNVGPVDLDVETQAVIYGDGKESEPVEKVRFRDLPDHPHYEDVYYAAGGPRRPRCITVDGVEVTVGGELYAALKRLRSGDERLVLWVDALCINQADLEERREHVKEMGRIYARAKRVRIWLGEELGNEHLAFEALNAIAAKIEKLHRDGVETNLRSAVFLQDKKIMALHWDSLSELLSRAWFERVWIIQEVANAADAVVQVGSITWTWSFFSTIVKLLRVMDIDLLLWSRGELTATDAVVLMDRLSLTQVRENASPRPCLLDILRDSRAFKCTLASDKIYGVLGLSSAPDCIEIDYSLDPAEVYKRFAFSYLSDRRSLDILYCCAMSSRKSRLTLPSWVPDWTQTIYHEPFTFRGYGSRAAGDSQVKFKLEDETNRLIISGKLIDVVEAVEQIRKIPRNTDIFYKEGLSFWGSRHEAWLETIGENLREWTNNVMNIAFPDKTCTAESYECLWRSFICNKTVDGQVPPAKWGQYFSDFLVSTALPRSEQKDRMDEWRRENPRRIYDLREQAESQDPLMEKIKAITVFKQAHGMWCYNRRFFRSKAGRFGWAPGTTQPGDQICVLYGGDVPFVLRPAENGCHEIVGDGYLQDFMNGEAMETGLEEREFCLI